MSHWKRAILSYINSTCQLSGSTWSASSQQWRWRSHRRPVSLPLILSTQTFYKYNPYQQQPSIRSFSSFEFVSSTMFYAKLPHNNSLDVYIVVFFLFALSLYLFIFLIVRNTTKWRTVCSRKSFCAHEIKGNWLVRSWSWDICSVCLSSRWTR